MMSRLQLSYKLDATPQGIQQDLKPEASPQTNPLSLEKSSGPTRDRLERQGSSLFYG